MMNLQYSDYCKSLDKRLEIAVHRVKGISWKELWLSILTW